MPVFNGADYLSEAASSILAQTHKHIELIIVDDGSTDRSVAAARSVSDSRIRVIQIDHGGAGRARNVGIAAARGDYIAFMDADDLALPRRLECQLAYMQQSGVEICGGCAKEFGDGNRLFWCPESHQTIVNDLFFRCALLVPAIMMRAEIAKSHPFDEGVAFEDYALWTRLAPRYRMANLQQIVFRYRNHDRQLHKLAAEDCAVELRRLRELYFRTVFPDADADDYVALNRAVECSAAQNLAELERTGSWLARLAAVPDNQFRDFLGRRWLQVCRMAAPLGYGTYRAYSNFETRFGRASGRQKIRLKLLCGMRIPPLHRAATRAA